MCRRWERPKKWKSAVRNGRRFIRGAGDRAGFFTWRSGPIRGRRPTLLPFDHFSLARVGVPSFSINEGIKFAGHDAQWGDEQAKDFTVHRYHQPSDEYSPDMDFTGDAVIARFGFVLGSKAAWLPTLPGLGPRRRIRGCTKEESGEHASW